MKTKLLVIDDRWKNERETVYLKVLSDFDVISVEKGSQLFEIIAKTEVDAYIVDIVLSGWTDSNNKPLQVMTVLEKIENNKPIILVSNEYDNLVKDKELTPLINAIIDKGINVNSFLIWSDFMKAASSINNNETQTIQGTINLDILKYLKIQKKKDENIFDFAVICALGEELNPFLEKFSDITNTTIENIHIRKGVFNTKSGTILKFLAVKQQEMGNTDAAIIASTLTSKFHIQHIFMIGVCGGRDGKVKIGDIVIPHEIIAYQKGKIDEGGIKLDHGTAKSKGNIQGAIDDKCNSIIQNIYENYMSILVKSGHSISLDRPTIKYDEMACGEIVIDKENELDDIADKVGKRKLCSVDLESFSIYRVCEVLNINASVIKSVMDLSKNKSDEYKRYACYVSANFLYSIIYEEVITFN